MKNHRARCIAAPLAGILGAALAAAHSAQAQCQYVVTATIEGPPCGPFQSPLPLIGRDLNSHGHVVGSHKQCLASGDEAFYWAPESGMVTLPRPSGVVSAIATGLNDAGAVVGGHAHADIGWKGFVYNPATRSYNYLEPLHPGVVATTVSSVNAINSAGIAVGSRIISKPGVVPAVSNAVIWNTNTGEVIDLGVGEGPRSEAMDISESGEYVVGWANGTGSNHGQAAIWTNGKLQVIGPLPGTDNSIANAVSESGVAIGSGLAQSPVVWRAFVWDGAMTIIDPIDDWQHSRGQESNDLGQAFILFSKPSQIHVPLLWQHGELHHLNSLLADGSPDVQLTGTGATNNSGQVLCSASTRAVLLTPADRPLTDLNADCVTDVHDLLMLLDAWGPVPRSANVPADFNGDGVVDVSDLLILLHNWTKPERR